VRSLYYDTYDYKLYHEKMSGDSERVKLRIRTYTKCLEDSPDIRAEMKIRKGNAMEKLGILINPSYYKHFIERKKWPQNDDDILNEFERLIHLWSLEPQTLIQYYREGYEDREKEGVRITFDHKVSGAHANSLFPDTPVFFRSFYPHTVVMEIKCKEKQPVWLKHIVRNYGLRWVANSKFTQGIQASRKDLYHPGGVVVIR